MKIRYVMPTTYVDVNLWLVFEDPVSGKLEVFLTPLSTQLVDVGNPLLKFKHFLEERFGMPIELEDCGYWDNVKDLDGTIIHPFTKVRTILEEGH